MKDRKSGLLLRFLLSIAGGILFIFAFPPFNIWGFAFFSFIPLLIAGKENDSKNFLFGLIAGFVFYSASFSWLYRLAGPIYLLLALYLSFYWGLFLYLVFAIHKRGRIFIAGFVWFLMEIIITHLLTGFPWLLAGLSQWNNPYLLKTASFTGIYGLSFLVIIGNFTLFYSFRKQQVVSWCISIVLFAILVFSPLFTPFKNNYEECLNVLIVQPNIDSTESHSPSKNIEKVKTLTTESIKEGYVDIVIWPEGIYPDIITPDIIDDLKNFARQFNVGLIFGTFTGDDKKIYNSAVIIENERVQVYNKTHLVPYGEFVPCGKCRIIRDLFEKIAGYTPYVERGKKIVPLYFKDKKLGILICFENIFPEIVQSFVEKEVDMFIVITNDSWFGNSSGPYQHFAHNSIRAVESGRYFVQSSLTGISGIVSPDGTVNIVKRYGKHLFVEGIMLYNVPLIKGKTYYSMVGDLPLFILSVIFIGAILCRKT
ncbi:MAG: apolipoprotein N-acyltransferase [Candidatus Ratteibacteria bacterium]|nr:apolipoprotein N-acyltransferase [Candidatus Ratteibacteria bacterium]